MARLTEEQKAFVVKGFACFKSGAEIAREVRAEFGVDVDRRQIWAYNPENPQRDIGKKWLPLFEKVRRRYLEDESDIPVAFRPARLRELQDLILRAKRTGNEVLVIQALEQAAKEIGGAYTNRRELTGRDGGPIETSAVAKPSSRRDEDEALRAAGLEM